MIVWALYGGNFEGRYFWHHPGSCINHLDFESCLVDPGVWMRDSTHTYGTNYYEYVLLYIEYCLKISDKSKDILQKDIGRYF